MKCRRGENQLKRTGMRLGESKNEISGRKEAQITANRQQKSMVNKQDPKNIVNLGLLHGMFTAADVSPKQ